MRVCVHVDAVIVVLQCACLHRGVSQKPTHRASHVSSPCVQEDPLKETVKKTEGGEKDSDRD